MQQFPSPIIMRLPNEILIPIFVHFNEYSTPLPISKQRSTLSGVNPTGTSWTKLMLVCRRWRDVACTTPMLWRSITVVDGKTTDWYKLALERSSPATIDVVFLLTPITEDHLAIFAPHWQRLRYLRVDMWTSAAAAIFDNPLPTMESLEIHDRCFRFEVEQGFADLRMTAQRFPALTIMSLTVVIAPTDQSLFAQLRKLALGRCACALSLEQFVELLANSLCLEHLILIEFLDHLSKEGERDERGMPPRPLRSLHRLQIGDHSPPSSSRFLSRISLPPTASLSVGGIVMLDPNSTLASALLPPQRSHNDTLPGLTTITHASLVVKTGRYSILCQSAHPGDGEIHIGLIYLSQYYWAKPLSDVLADFILIAGASLANLKIDGDCSTADSGTWATVFQTFPALSCLYASAAKNLFSGLLAACGLEAATSTTDSDERLTRTTCAQLEEVWIEGGKRETTEEMMAALDAALVWLRWRAKRGFRLKKLRVMACNSLAGKSLRGNVGTGDGLEEVLKEKYLPELLDVVEDVAFGGVKD